MTAVRIIPYAAAMRGAPAHWLAFTLGNTIYLRGDSIDPALLAHEILHTQQFAMAGGVVRGLCQWLWLLAWHGYDNHPWEQEARRFEQKVRDDPPLFDTLFRIAP